MQFKCQVVLINANHDRRFLHGMERDEIMEFLLPEIVQIHVLGRMVKVEFVLL